MLYSDAMTGKRFVSYLHMKANMTKKKGTPKMRAAIPIAGIDLADPRSSAVKKKKKRKKKQIHLF